MIVFGLGGITCVLSILRLQSLYVISVSTDVSWDNPLAAMWSSMEINVGIICSVSTCVPKLDTSAYADKHQCIPTLKGMLTRMFPSLAVGESYFSSHNGNLGPPLEGRPDAVDFQKLGHTVSEGDMEKATEATTELYELGNRSARDLSAIPKRQSSMLPPPATRPILTTPPQVLMTLQNWLGKDIGHIRTDTVETAESSETTQTTETTTIKRDTTRSDSESTIELCKAES